MVNFIIMNNYLFSRSPFVTSYYRFDGPELRAKSIGMMGIPRQKNALVVWLAKVNNRGWTLECSVLTGRDVPLFLSRGEWELHQLDDLGLANMLAKRQQDLDLHLENV